MKELTSDMLYKPEMQEVVPMAPGVEDEEVPVSDDAMASAPVSEKGEQAAEQPAEEKKDPNVLDFTKGDKETIYSYKWDSTKADYVVDTAGATADYEYGTKLPTIDGERSKRINLTKGISERIWHTESSASTKNFYNRTTKRYDKTIKQDGVAYKGGKYTSKTVDAPVTLDPEAKPELEDLVTFGSGTLAKRLQGTIDCPNKKEELVPNCLFINQTTCEDDVHQCNVGDCYFLSAVLSVLHADPQRIVNLMSISGDTVTTRLYRKDKESGEWVETRILTKYGLATRKRDFETPEVMGSYFRVAYDPRESAWTANVEADTLKINKTNYYEAAMWVNCLEQAFAHFAQTYGQYGTGPATAKGERYGSTINGGFHEQCLNLFYGNDVQDDACKQLDAGTTFGSGYYQSKTYDEIPKTDAELIQKNSVVIENLYKFEDSKKEESETAMYLGAWITTQDMLHRLIEQAKLLQDEIAELKKTLESESNVESDSDTASEISAEQKAKLENYDKINASVGRIKIDAIQYYTEASKPQSARREGVFNKLEKEIQGKMDTESRNLIALKAHEQGFKQYQTFIELMGTAVCKTRDFTQNNVFIYSMHAYNVKAANLKKGDGKVSTTADYKELLQKLANAEDVDATAVLNLDTSEVVMQNPHGTTKPQLNTREADQEKGTFTISVRSFLNNFGYLNTATVNRTVENGLKKPAQEAAPEATDDATTEAAPEPAPEADMCIAEQLGV